MPNPKTPTAEGHGRFEFRPGVGGFPRWAGQERDGDPVKSSPNRPGVIVNGYPRNGEILSRGGQARVNTTAFSGCVVDLYDHQITSPTRLWIVFDGCPGVSATAGFSINFFDQEHEPQYNRVTNYGSATTVLRLGAFSDQLYIGLDDTLYLANTYPADYGVEYGSISGQQFGQPIKTFGGSITALHEFDSKLFIAIDDGAGTSYIESYDGVTFTEDLASINAPTGFGTWRDYLVAGFDTATGEVQIRDRGDAPGTWTPKTLTGAGMTTRGVSYKDEFYMVAGSDVFVLSGATLTAATLTLDHTITGATLYDLTIINNTLCIVYDSATPVTGVVATFDGTTWTDTAKDLTAQFSSVASARRIESYRNNLIVGAISNPGALNGVRLYFSPDGTVTGTWTELTPDPTVLSSDIYQFLVF